MWKRFLQNFNRITSQIDLIRSTIRKKDQHHYVAMVEQFFHMSKWCFEYNSFGFIFQTTSLHLGGSSVTNTTTRALFMIIIFIDLHP